MFKHKNWCNIAYICLCKTANEQVIATHKHAHTFIWFLSIKEALPFQRVAPNDGLKTSALHRTEHHLPSGKSPVRWIKLQIWRYRGIIFTVCIDYWTLLQMVRNLSIENRCEGGQRLQHGKTVLMKDMWITKTILILSLFLPIILKMSLLCAGKKWNANLSHAVKKVGKWLLPPLLATFSEPLKDLL